MAWHGVLGMSLLCQGLCRGSVKSPWGRGRKEWKRRAGEERAQRGEEQAAFPSSFYFLRQSFAFMESEARGASWCITHKAQCGVAALHPMPTASAPNAAASGEGTAPPEPGQDGEKRDQTSVMPLLPLIPCWSCWGDFALSAEVLPCQSQGKPNSNSSEPVLIL